MGVGWETQAEAVGAFVDAEGGIEETVFRRDTTEGGGVVEADGEEGTGACGVIGAGGRTDDGTGGMVDEKEELPAFPEGPVLVCIKLGGLPKPLGGW